MGAAVDRGICPGLHAVLLGMAPAAVNGQLAPVHREIQERLLSPAQGEGDQLPRWLSLLALSAR
jgi:hypothetical protein